MNQAEGVAAVSQSWTVDPFNPERVFALMTGRASSTLTEEVARLLKTEVVNVKWSDFADGETHLEIVDSIRDKDVFLLQSTCPPVNRNIMDLIILLDAISRASPRTLTLALPYFGYGRQDRKAHGREPISSSVIADVLCEAGNIYRIITLDLHAPQTQGVFKIKCGDHFYATAPLTTWIKENVLSDTPAVIASPDSGGLKRARAFAKLLGGLPISCIDKSRPRANEVEVGENIIGDVAGKDVIIVDDMVDTAGTLVKAAAAFMNEGANRVFAVATHGVLSDPAFERIASSEHLVSLAITDTIPLREGAPDKIKVVTVAPLFAEAFYRIFRCHPVSSMIGWIGS